ncbi:MAG: hypothetical protein ACXVIJ_15835 [Thermoanaerobaculia bacterium]
MFDVAKRAALMSDIVRTLRGQPVDLLPFEEVREKLRLRSVIDRGVEEIPIDRIVGSFGREREFNRAFLPRTESLRRRWQKIHDQALGLAGLPRIELFKVGDAFFVLDGHHRVSVARALGAPTIEAHVREWETDVAIGPEDSIEELVLRRGRADFLEATQIDAADDELTVTEPDGYERLLDHVSKHHYYMGLNEKREVPWTEAVRSWRETVYRPTIAVIRESGVLAEFPGRTETDLYLFAMEHLHFLRERYGEKVEPAAAVQEMVVERSKRAFRRLRALWRRKRTKQKT